MVTAEAPSTLGLAVAATLLGETPFRFETVLEDLGGGAPRFLSAHQIIVGSPVKMETEDLLWMGTVSSCHREGTQWRATMRVEHELRNLPELLRLAARFK